MVKKTIRIFIALTFFASLSLLSFADLPPDDPAEFGPGTGDKPVGGGSPLGGGLIILASLGAAYGARKVYNLQQSE